MRLRCKLISRAFAALGSIHGGISFVEENFSSLSMIGTDADSNAGRDLQLVRTDSMNGFY